MQFQIKNTGLFTLNYSIINQSMMQAVRNSLAKPRDSGIVPKKDRKSLKQEKMPVKR